MRFFYLAAGVINIGVAIMLPFTWQTYLNVSQRVLRHLVLDLILQAGFESTPGHSG